MSKKQSLRKVSAPIYRYWQALYLSFYSNRLYVDVVKRWRGFGALYLLLLIGVVTIPLAMRITIYFNHYFDEQTSPLGKLPPLYIQNGEIIFDKPMPYFIKEKGKVVAIIDTTGNITTLDHHPNVTLLITKTKLFYRPPQLSAFLNLPPQSQDDQVFVQTLGKENNEVFVGKDWLKSSGVLNLKHIAEILVYPLMASFIYGMVLVLLLFIACIGQFFSQILFKLRLTFKESSRLFFVASTPAIILLFILWSLSVFIPFGSIFYIGLLAIYFSFAVLSVRRESQKMVHT